MYWVLLIISGFVATGISEKRAEKRESLWDKTHENDKPKCDWSIEQQEVVNYRSRRVLEYIIKYYIDVDKEILNTTDVINELKDIDFDDEDLLK